MDTEVAQFRHQVLLQDIEDVTCVFSEMNMGEVIVAGNFKFINFAVDSRFRIILLMLSHALAQVSIEGVFVLFLGVNLLCKINLLDLSANILPSFFERNIILADFILHVSLTLW